jgi:hypothetical protein
MAVIAVIIFRVGDLELDRIIVAFLIAATLFAIACFAWFVFNSWDVRARNQRRHQARRNSLSCAVRSCGSWDMPATGGVEMKRPFRLISDTLFDPPRWFGV